MSASSSAIQRAISSAENTRGSGSAAPSARSRDARKSINSCFSAGESETAAASISASVTIRTSVHALKAVCKVHVPCPRAHAPNHFHQRAASWCNRLRSRSLAPPRHDRWVDAGVRVHLPRPFAEHRSGPRCELTRPPADWKVSRFLSHLFAQTACFPHTTAVVTNPTRGALALFVRDGTKPQDDARRVRCGWVEDQNRAIRDSSIGWSSCPQGPAVPVTTGRMSRDRVCGPWCTRSVAIAVVPSKGPRPVLGLRS